MPLITQNLEVKIYVLRPSYCTHTHHWFKNYAAKHKLSKS